MILQANLEVAAMLGVARSDLFKKLLGTFIVADDQGVFHLWRQMILLGFAPQECELRLVCQDGAQMWVRLQALVVLEADEVGHLRLVLNDITKYRQRKVELLAANVELVKQFEKNDRPRDVADRKP